MRKSARLLGKDYGLTAEEMNCLLKQQGYLDGEPGEYWPTEKGKQFASEIFERRGTGGYERYNPSWTKRSWDESILDELDLSDDALCRAADEVVERRNQRLGSSANGRAYSVGETTRDQFQSEMDGDDSKEWLSTTVGTAIAGLVTYIAVPIIRDLWREKAQPKIDELSETIKAKLSRKERTASSPNDNKTDKQGES